MSNGYKITRSNYTIKKRHQTTSGGVVFERDFMTTTNLGGWDSGSIPYGESNFKMFYRLHSNAKKRTYNGEWLKVNCGGSETEILTEECLPTKSVGSSKIVIKPNYNSLLDFAYYGSCVELVKNTVTNVIKNFPAEMYVEDGEEYGFPNTGILINNFDIDLRNDIVPNGENELRYFLKSFSEYSILNGGISYAIGNVGYKDYYRPGVVEHPSQYTDSEKEFFSNRCNFTLNVDGIVFSGITYSENVSAILSPINYVGVHIRPSEKHLINFFNNLDDFGKVLLNTETEPKYCAVLDTPRETEHGVETYRVTYKWPVDNDYNLLIDGEEFRAYINGLLSVSEFYDEYYTNNLWRMLTHDSIKAMDLAFSNPEKDEDSEDYNIGTSRLEMLMMAIGHQFDEIKRAIDNVKNTSRITYDENNNIPDYFLTDILSLAGWETKNIDIQLNREERTGQLFPGINEGFGSTDANNAFLRNLKLNSKAILAKKGTRQGIEEVLSLFGLMSYDMWRLLPEDERPSMPDYIIQEYVQVVTHTNQPAEIVNNFEDIFNPTLDIEKWNVLKLSYDNSELPEGEHADTLQGIPCRVNVMSEDGTIYKYPIPWFDKNKKYDGNLYYQSRGGWGLKDANETDSDLENGVGYDETVKYLVIVEKTSDLRNIPESKLYDSVIAYVNELEEEEYHGEYQYEIDNAQAHYSEDTVLFGATRSNSTSGDGRSHYYVLNKKSDYYDIGEDTEGWNNIKQSEIDDTSTDISKKVNYIEHIVENYLGNNPHVGFGKYDIGQEYIDYIKVPLKYSIDKEEKDKEQMFHEGAYDCNGVLQFDGKLFELDERVDNMRCWYFEPLTKNGIVNELSGTSVSYEEVNNDSHSTVGGSDRTYETNISTFNFITEQTGNIADEITCDSIVNTKRLVITFNVETYDENVELTKFLKTSVVEYLNQALPSGSIMRTYVVDNEKFYYEINNPQITYQNS